MNNYPAHSTNPGMQATPRVAGYQQYGSSTMGSHAANEGMVSYPTSHIYSSQGSVANAVPPPPATPPPISDPVTKAVVDNILGKLPTKKNQVTHRCEVCDQEFSGRTVLETHLQGAKHAKKLKSLEILNQLAASGQNFSQSGPGGNLRCEACGIDANSSQQLQTHLAGNKHKQKMIKLGNKAPDSNINNLAMLNPGSPTTNVPQPVPSVPSASEPGLSVPQSGHDFSQSGSDFTQPGPSFTQACLAGQQTSNVNTLSLAAFNNTESQDAKNLYCQFCNVPLNSTLQMQQHMESRRHKERENPAPKQHSNKHHPYRRVPQARFNQPTRSGKKKKQPVAFLTPLSSSFVPGSTML